jgi:hypothetical protein
MNGKITLITPPDIFENSNFSLLFVNLSEDDQTKVSEWFAKSDISENINIYFYDHEIEIAWLFHSMNRCEYKFINLDDATNTTKVLSSYMLSKSNVYYKISDKNNSEIYQYINQNKITNIETFLEKVFNEHFGT